MSESLDSVRFRTVMGQVPTSVVVVAGLDVNGQPHGITIGSFVSISLTPTLVGFFIGAESRTWPLISAGERFCVNVLAEHQGSLCWRFAAEEGHSFEGVDWSSSPGGSPRVTGAVAWVDCAVHATIAVGDHILVVGRVTGLESPEPEGAPMVFHRGKVAGVSGPANDR